MRKFIIALTGIILACTIVVPVYAAPTDPQGWSTDPVILAMMDTIPDVTGKNPNDQFYSSIWNLGFNPQDNAYLFLYNMSGNLWAYVSSDLILNGNLVTVPANCKYVNYSVTLNESNVYTGSNSYTVQLSSEFQWIGAYNDIVAGDMFDYSIPNFTGLVTSSVSGAPDSAIVPLKLRYKKILLSEPDTTQYRVEVKGRFGMPTIIDISKNGGELYYDYSGYEWTDFINIYTYEDNKHLSIASGVAAFELALPTTISQWTNLVNDNVNDLTFNWHYNELNTTKNAMMNTFKAFNAVMAGIQPNKFDIYVRYVKVENGLIKYGRWTHLTNSDIAVINQPYENIPSIPVDLPSGRSVLDDDQVNNQIDNNVPDPYIMPDITINNNVQYPQQNTLNYPTIATYNKDQLLLDTLDMAQHMPTWFESCVAAFQLCFSLIHPAIWTIIGFGFMLSIVVMVLKVL